MAFTIVTSVNNEEVLEKNLLKSPGLIDHCPHQLLIKRGFASASLAYNSGLDESSNEIIIFVHQDIYLPDTWFPRLEASLAILEISDPNWGVLGCFGSRRGAHGGVGRVYTSGLGWHGRTISHPETVETLDEIVLIIRKASGLRFDPVMPHFHLYGPDICLTAGSRGMVNYAFQNPCVHNTNQLPFLPREFYACYRYIRRKWSRHLPIYTSCMTVTTLNVEFYRKRLAEAKDRLLGTMRPTARRVEDPRAFVEAAHSR